MIFPILYNYYNYCNNNPIKICHMLLTTKNTIIDNFYNFYIYNKCGLLCVFYICITFWINICF